MPATNRRTAGLRAEPLEDRVTPAGNLLQTLTGPPGGSVSRFGSTVALDGDLLVVGAPEADAGGATAAGVAYVFDVATGALVATLANPTPAAQEKFGTAVAIDGTRVVVGVPSEYTGRSYPAGAAYVFDATSGALVATLANPDPAPAGRDNFGISVAVSGNRAVVGADLDGPGGVEQVGAAYVFDLTTGALVATLANPGPAAYEQFGTGVAVDGDRAVVGTLREGAGGVYGDGAAYVFDLTTGALVATLTNPGPTATGGDRRDGFGEVVAVSGNRVVVGAWLEDPGGVGSAGAAYVFDADTGGVVATLTSPAPVPGDFFGDHVAIDGNRVVVGTGQGTSTVNGNSGVAYVFDLAAGPAPVATLTNPETDPGRVGDNAFIQSVAVGGGRAVLGMPYSSGYSDAGAAYVFDVAAGPAPPSPLTVTPATLPGGRVGTAYAQTITTDAVGGGYSAVTFAVTAGSLPPGLAVADTADANGEPTAAALTGTPTAAGTFTFTLTATDALQGTGGSRAYTVAVAPAEGGNTPPTVGPLADETIAPGSNTAGPFVVDIGDAETPADDLVLTVATSDPDVLPAGSVVINGTGARRMATVTPAAGRVGTATVTVTVTDTGGLSASDTFAVTVLPAARIPQPIAVGGSPDARAAVYTPTPGSGRYDAAPALTADLFGAAANVRTAVGDVDGDGYGDTVLVTGPGPRTRYAVVSGRDGATVLIPPTTPFSGSEAFDAGGFVAAADLDGDGRAEVVVTPDLLGGPRVVVFALRPGGAVDRVANFFGIEDDTFRGGARAALGDVDADGVPELAVAAGFAGGPRVALYAGRTLLGGAPARLLNDFYAYPEPEAVALRNGVYLAVGDVDGDGCGDLVVGAGRGGSPRLYAVSGRRLAAGDLAGAQAAPLANFFVAGDDRDRNGVRVAATDADGDGRADLATGTGEGLAARTRVYLGKDMASTAEPGAFQDLAPFGEAALADGVYVG